MRYLLNTPLTSTKLGNESHKLYRRIGAAIVFSNEATNMPFRMAEYLIMLTRKYHLPVQQYVIYIGEQALTMKGELQLENLHFNYELINLATVDYHLFLHADKPEEKMLAMLANFGNDNPETVITQIANILLAPALCVE